MNVSASEWVLMRECVVCVHSCDVGSSIQTAWMLLIELLSLGRSFCFGKFFGRTWNGFWNYNHSIFSCEPKKAPHILRQWVHFVVQARRAVSIPKRCWMKWTSFTLVRQHAWRWHGIPYCLMRPQMTWKMCKKERIFCAYFDWTTLKNRFQWFLHRIEPNDASPLQHELFRKNTKI